MYRILEKRQLSEVVWEMVVEAPLLASHAKPGQFLIVRKDEVSERIPLTICDYDAEKGTVTIVFQPVGASTMKYLELNEGDCFEDVVGPLGRPSDILEMSEEELKQKKFLFVCGGVGTAPVYPQVKWLHQHGIAADVIIGWVNIYASIHYVMERLEEASIPVVQSAGIPSFITAAASAGLSLISQQQRLTILPGDADAEMLHQLLSSNHVVVVMKLSPCTLYGTGSPATP